MRIALDVMGGDHGCGVVIDGVKLALAAYPKLTELLLVGNQADIEKGLARVRCRDSRVRIVHASEVLTMDDKPLAAVRKKKDASIVRAVELVRDGRAQAVISTGNTGGLVAAAAFKLRRLDGVDRPAIATVMPSARNEFVLLDAGANSHCRPIHLLQFALMGSIYSREILGYKRPRVGVLSNGTEEFKGNELTRAAARLCRQTNLNFIGYVEGHDLFTDRVEVVVTDGFTGNIVLKASEALAKAIGRFLKSELAANPIRKLGAAVASGAFLTIKRRMDPDSYGGAPILGLNGIVIKAHGAARENAIKNAVRVAIETIQHQVNDLIGRDIAVANERLAATEVAEEVPTFA
jgi:glycerol-3-phosphate acyltransferase PlsX